MVALRETQTLKFMGHMTRRQARQRTIWLQQDYDLP
jgi:hypothetical protein